jgi:hypothetical protein
MHAARPLGQSSLRPRGHYSTSPHPTSPASTIRGRSRRKQLRQCRTPRPASIIDRYAWLVLVRAVRRQFAPERRNRLVQPKAGDRLVQPVSALPGAAAAIEFQHGRAAGDVAEGDEGAGHAPRVVGEQSGNKIDDYSRSENIHSRTPICQIHSQIQQDSQSFRYGFPRCLRNPLTLLRLSESTGDRGNGRDVQSGGGLQADDQAHR